MKHSTGRALLPLALVLVLSCAQIRSQTPPDPLVDTAWQFVRFRSGDGTVLTPDARPKYTIAFADHGVLNVRFDCNRGRGTWKSPSPGQIQFGPLALTRVMCPPGSLHDHMIKQWPFVRSYIIKSGDLFLSLMADGGTFEFEPLP